jgi:hypothetical protein
MIKTVVHYSGILLIREWLFSEEDDIHYVAHLQQVYDHPKLGYCRDVRSSSIVKFPDNKGTFETRNTIYEKADAAYMMGHNELNQDS